MCELCTTAGDSSYSISGTETFGVVLDFWEFGALLTFPGAPTLPVVPPVGEVTLDL